ncbi:MAG: hypothetical protein PUF72_00150 [Clostridiales bacterium]|nr:hypothetical protein [Clostridiales bacterium]
MSKRTTECRFSLNFNMNKPIHKFAYDCLENQSARKKSEYIAKAIFYYEMGVKVTNADKVDDEFIKLAAEWSDLKSTSDTVLNVPSDAVPKRKRGRPKKNQSSSVAPKREDNPKRFSDTSLKEAQSSQPEVKDKHKADIIEKIERATDIEIEPTNNINDMGSNIPDAMKRMMEALT